MSGTARPRHFAEFMRSMYPAFSRRATQVCILSGALEKIAEGATDAPAIARAALEQADPFGWVNRAACEVERNAAKCWRQPCADAGQCTAPASGVGVVDNGRLVAAADQHADNYEGEPIPANEVRAAITNAFYAGARFAAAGVALPHGGQN